MSNFKFYYKVYFTTLIRKNVYGITQDVDFDVDVSDYIKIHGIGKIKQDVDNGDFDIGIFTYSNITLDIVNNNGKFNIPQDPRSMFFYSRDLTKVRIEFFDNEGNNYTSFKGVINDDATKQNYTKKTVKFQILSYDSILKRVIVSAGSIPNGDTFKTAMTKILNRVEVLSLLNFDVSNLNLGLNLTVDDGSYFDNKTSRNAMNDLLLVSNSVLIIDNSDNILVKERTENINTPWELYNDGDLQGRENITVLKDFNTGMQRMFNSIKVNNVVSNEDDYIETFNLNQKEYNFDFITNTDTATEIANTILKEFKAPKVELSVEVSSKDFNSITLLDIVRYNHKSVLKPADGQSKLSFYDQAFYNVDHYNVEIRELHLSVQIKYKVISINKKPKDGKTILKIRQTGNNISDGYFT